MLAPEGPGGVEYGDREAFAFHLYCPPGTNEFICDGMIDLNWKSILPYPCVRRAKELVMHGLKIIIVLTVNVGHAKRKLLE